MRKAHAEEGFAFASLSPHPDGVLTPEQCAAWLQLHRRTLQRAGVPHVVISHKVRRYRVRDVLRWLEQQTRGVLPPDHEPGP